MSNAPSTRAIAHANAQPVVSGNDSDSAGTPRQAPDMTPDHLATLSCARAQLSRRRLRVQKVQESFCPKCVNKRLETPQPNGGRRRGKKIPYRGRLGAHPGRKLSAKSLHRKKSAEVRCNPSNPTFLWCISTVVC